MRYYDIHTHRYLSTSANSASVYNLSEDEIKKGGIPELANLYYSSAIHPWHIANGVISIEDIYQLAISSKKIVAIGECGLDKLIDIPMEVQKRVFVQQIELATKLDLPLIIHCVKAWDQLLELYREHRSSNPWILHGFRGERQQTEQLMKFGFYFSIGEYFNSDALVTIAPKHLFLETDESSLPIQDIYTQVANALSFEIDELIMCVEQNVRRVFDL